MGKIKTILIVVGMLWLISFFSAKLLSINKQEIITEGIAIIPIDGAIGVSSDDFLSRVTSSDKILEDLKRAEENKGIKSIILEINSPGGGVVASKEIAKAVEKSEKPVIAWIREVGASGAYWVASSADYIIADEMSITGSIGVFSSYLEFSGLLERYNITYERLIAGEYKDMGSIYKKLNKDEREMLQEKLDIIHDFFIKEVAKNRKLNEEDVKKIANGEFYLGIEAKELKLIDEFGGREEAIKKAKELSGIKDGNIVEFKEKISLFEFLKRLKGEVFYSIGRGIGRSFIEEDYLEIRA